MDFAEAVEQVRSRPDQILSSHCVLALGAFFVGYKTTDAGAMPILDSLDGLFEGPSGARACTRAYLSSRTTEEALHRVLDATTRLLLERGAPAPTPGHASSTTFVADVRGPIEQGRPGMVLGETTPAWLYDYSQGYLLGLEAVNPELAERQRLRLAAFETWLRRWYDNAAAPWYSILRVYGGACEAGLASFVKKWDIFERECPETGPA